MNVLKTLHDDLKVIITETRELDKLTDKAGDEIAGRDFMHVVLLSENSAKVFQKRLRDYCDTSDQSIGSVPSPTDVGTDMSGSDSSPSFGFPTSARKSFGPRNIKNLIWWHPVAFRWAIWIQKPKKDDTLPKPGDFKVNSLLQGYEFNKEYERVFVEAATIWNKLDHSKRDRIVLTDDAPSSQHA